MSITEERVAQAKQMDRMQRLSLRQGLARTVRSETLIAIVLLWLALALFYRDVVFQGRTFLLETFTAGTMPLTEGSGPYAYPGEKTGYGAPPAKDPGAIGWQLEPYSRRAGQMLRSGVTPLWNPSAGLGEPMLVDGNSAALEPIQVLFYLVPERFWALAVDIQVLVRFFMAGFFTYLFVRALGLPLLPAVFAGTAFMLCSYFVVFGNHPQMKPETLMPVVLYGYERYQQRRTLASLSLCAGAIAWVLVASFPQSGFMALLLASMWAAYRAFWQICDARFAWSVIWRRILGLGAAVVAGLGLAAFFLMPLAENIAQSLNVHDPGMGLQGFPEVLSLVSMSQNIVSTVWWSPHFYVTVVFLALIGVIYSAFQLSYSRQALFFSIYGVVFFLKTYSFEPVQWIGRLPLLSQVNIGKYAASSVSFCFAVVAAFGLDMLMRRKISIRIVPVLLAFMGLYIWHLAFQWNIPELNPRWVVAGVLVMLVVVTTICLVIVFSRIPQHGYMVPYLLLALLMAEAGVLHTRIVRPLRYDPYTQPPFVQFLKAQPGPYRVLGLDGIMYPNISTAYGIDDVRFLTALLSKRRFLYVAQFIAPGNIMPTYLMQPGDMISDTTIERASATLINPAGIPNAGELVDTITRLTGTENPLYLGKYLDLLNTKYILTSKARSFNSSLDLLSMQRFADLLNQPPLAIQPVDVAGDIRTGVFMHPPNQAAIPLLLPAGKLQLEFGISINQQVWQQNLLDGDGVTYHVTLTDATGDHTIFSRYIDPKHHSEERHWQEMAVDLSPWSGQRVVLTFSTGTGPTNDGRYDWAFWSNPIIRMIDTPNSLAQFPADRDTLDLIRPILDQNVGKQNQSFTGSTVTIEGVQHSTLFMHPNNSVDIRVHLPDTSNRLTFAIGMAPEVWQGQPVGDGVGFGVQVVDGITATTVFDKYIDPKHNLAERRWFDQQIDLTSWRGKQIVLRFITTSGPTGDVSADWAHWGSIQITSAGIGRANPSLTHFELIYDQEIQIYRNNYAYPRAFVVYNVVPAAATDAALRILGSTSFDPSMQAVVENMPAGWDQRLIAGKPATGATSAQIVEQSSDSMHVSANLDKPGLLVVSELYNSGWKAYVDGKPAAIVPTDVMLRGVYLDAGHHDIEFVYAPLSFTIGATISILTLLGFAVAFVILRVRHRHRNEHV